MLEITKRKIGGDPIPPEEQPGPKRSNVVKPFSHHGGSLFQPWKPSFAEGDNNINIQKSTPNHVAEKNLSKDVGDEKTTRRDDQVQTDKPSGSGCNSQLDMDSKKMKRILSNRASSRKSRMKKIEYVADMEQKEKSYQSTIASLQPQIATYENQKRELLIEHHRLKLQMAICEKQRILKEVEIEKNKAEVNRLNELYKNLTIKAPPRKMNTTVAVQFMPNSNLNSSGFGQCICLNSNQAQNEAPETSRVQRYRSQQLQNQSQMGNNWNNGHMSNPI